MFTPFKGRTISEGQPVRVYRNLHKKGTTYSIMDRKTGLVLGYASEMRLERCTFDVYEKRREQVLATGKKNVHAYISGNYYHFTEDDLDVTGVFVEYNPYKHSSFINKWTGYPIKDSQATVIVSKMILAVV